MNASDRMLDAEAHSRVFIQRIVPDSGLNEATAQSRPRAIYLAGQPGAGKGGLGVAAEIELRHDVVKIDPDELRDGHLEVDRFRSERPYTWSGDTHGDASQWARELREAAIEGKKNIIVDTTLGNGEAAVSQIRELQAKGYEVEIRAMATHRVESELGVDKRFTDGVAKDGYGRYVPQEVRSHVYEKLPGNLDHVRAETGVPIRIFNREGAELYDSRASSLAPSEAMERAREARLNDPKVTRRTAESLKEQQALHQELPEALSRNSKVQPATAQALLNERSELKVVEGVDRLATEAAKIDHAVRVRPATLRGASAAGALGVVATAYDVADTTHDAVRLSNQGNQFGAESKIVGAVTRNVGGLGGVALGSAAGAAVTSETGPGALVGGVVGGIAGAVAGDKLAEWIDQHRINNQDDKQGNTWTFNPKHPEQGWTRRELDLDAMRYSEGVPVHKPGVIKADAALSDQLNYQASNRATELALSAPPKAQNPYEIPANAHDPRSFRDSPWERNAQTQQWTRHVAEGYIDKGVMQIRTDVATPQRAAELEQQSQAIIANNATKTPAALAASYQAAYDQYDWQRHGKVPPAVTDAARHPGRLVGSDGDTYERSNNGQWTSRGMVWDSKAEGNLKRELDATFDRQQQTLKVTTLAPVEVRADAEPAKETAAARSATPEDIGHPERPLYEKVRGAVEQFDRQIGKTWDAQSERMTASALAVAVEKKFDAKDDIRLAFNAPAPGVGAGEIVHVYRVGHPSPDPAAHHASMKTAEAVSVPVEDRYRQVEATRLAQAETTQREQQQEQTRNQSVAGQGGPKMTA
ncbi:zeta toxin family protein [Lysobacter sp. K5869]|uniref:zeta toxin family protein n=1 Tax=Lysobacter sp. K5869 TaxID=2820808 RepID=UPI001C0633AE|nr:zeta toxin family protein [Lysobacter sp. K5869]QWP75791.1 zeta toxin family protein [Lysobacter sp. K5869]